MNPAAEVYMQFMWEEAVKLAAADNKVLAELTDDEREVYVQRARKSLNEYLASCGMV